MTKLTKKDYRSHSLLLLAVLGIVLSGCGPSAAQEIDHTGEATRTKAAQDMRALFDKSKGDFNALSAEDKAAAIKLSGGNELNARAAFAGMKDGPAAAQAVMREGQQGGAGK